MPQGRSRIDIRNVPAKSRKLPSVREDVLLIEGVFEWGPLGATPVLDFDDAVEKYGWYLSAYPALLQLKLFFDDGGKYAVVNRIFRWGPSGAPATALKSSYTINSTAGTYGNQPTLKVEGLYFGVRGDTFSIKIQDASNGEVERFDLLVYEDGLFTGEWYRNLLMSSTDANYPEDVINTIAGKSRLITVTDQDGSGTTYDKRPANGTYALTGGNDGLASLDETDYVGTASKRTGLHAFTSVEDGDILVVPDKATTSFHNSATSYCETEKKGKVVFIPTPPANSDSDGIKTHAQALTASEARTAVPWPRIKVANPDKAIYGKADNLTVCPSGCYAATMARNSQRPEEAKQFIQPSNEEYGLLLSATGIETDEVLEPTVRDKITDYGVNPIVSGFRSADGNFGVWVDDCLAGKTTGNFQTVGENRGVATLRKRFEKYLQPHRTQGNTRTRREDIKTAFETELMQWTALHAFASDDPDEAFYVNTDPPGESLNNPLVQDAQQMRILVGLATARPARFIDLMFTRDNRAVESYIQQQLSSTT